MPKGTAKDGKKRKGKATPKSIFEWLRERSAGIDNPGPSTSGSVREYEEAPTKAEAVKTKKKLASLSPSSKQKYMELRHEKELERTLLPDAPPRKRQSRKPSPVRVECRLVEGTPHTPPPPKLRPWELRNLERTPETPPEQDPGTPITETSTVSWYNVVEVPGVSTENLNVPIAQPPSPPLPSLPPPEPVPSSSATKIVTKSLRALESAEASSDDDDDQVLIEEVEPLHEDADILPELMPPEAATWLQNEDLAGDEVLHELVRSNEQSVDFLQFNWSANKEDFHGTREVFKGTPGPTFPVTADMRPMEIFLKYFDSELLDLIVRRTNRHATIMIQKNTKEHSRLLKFINTDRAEIALFIAILILQGLAPLSVETEYWCENGHLTMNRFKELMPLSRFQLLKRLIYFFDASTKPTEDKLKKISPILDHLNRKFSELYRPAQDVAVDESLLKWHGRLSFAQKIATKAAKVGIKSYELCESSTGYLWRFFLYTGKSKVAGDDEETEESPANSDPTRPPPSSNVTAKIVCELMQPLLNLGHTVVMDNFYNSPLLARYLKANGTDCFGTIRTHREYMPDSIKSVQKSSMRVGELCQSYCRDLYVMLWRDSNVVTMISTFHKGDVGGKEKYGRYKYKPQIVLDYNKTMGGIDRKDALISHHPIERSRNIVWYKKVFRRVLNVAVLNSYIILKTQNQEITHRAFRARLANEMIEAFKPTPIERPVEVRSIVPHGGPRSIVRRPILKGNHFIAEGPILRAQCVFCRKSRTRYICEQCNLPLCMLPCFKQMHT